MFEHCEISYQNTFREDYGQRQHIDTVEMEFQLIIIHQRIQLMYALNLMK